jgi:hypothetical protein
VKGDINCKGEYIYMNGTVGGTAILAATEIQTGDSAAFQEEVRYWDSDGQVDFGSSMFDRKAIYDPALEIKTAKLQYLGFTTLFILIAYLLSALLTITVIQYLFSNIMRRSARQSYTASGRSIAYGLALMLAVPIVAILLLVSLIGIPIGMVLLTLMVILGALNSAILAVFLANILNNRNRYNWRNGKIAGVSFLMFLLIKVITLIPVIGWIVMLVATAAMFGAFIRHYQDSRKKPVA